MGWRPIAAAVVAAALLASVAPDARPPRWASADNRTMGYGIGTGDFATLAGMGMNWAKIPVNWGSLEPARGSYDAGAFVSLRNTLDRARSYGLSPLLAISHTPWWARSNHNDTAPPLDDNDLANFMAYLATYLRGRAAAYEIWNEPNLVVEWGMQQPDPVKFASMMRALYPRVKAADPAVLVITGGLSTAGDYIGDWSYGDLLYVKNLYQLGNIRSCADGQGGLRSCFDALGTHPYGGPFSPETGPDLAQYTVGLYFRRAEQQKQMMDVWGQDYDRGLFATEFGWLINPALFGYNCGWQHPWTGYVLPVPADQQEATQAAYLVGAYQYAYDNWPWMIGMIAFSIDARGWGVCDQVQWYSLTRPDGSRRSAFAALAGMPKPGITALPTIVLSDNTARFFFPSGSAQTSARTIHIGNGGGAPLNWTATKTQSWLTLGNASGTAPADLTIGVSASGLPDGLYTDIVTIAGIGQTQSGPQQVFVLLFKGPLSTVRLPAVTRN